MTPFFLSVRYFKSRPCEIMNEEKTISGHFAKYIYIYFTVSYAILTSHNYYIIEDCNNEN